jgi:hypothetical protein
MPKPKTHVYVDGFNFYYGAVRGTPHKWLDLDRFFTMMRPSDDIRVIKYFTAEIVGPTKPNQDVFLKALATRPRVQVILGRFKMKSLKCEVDACDAACTRYFDKPEEKRTDVNIATEMIDDAYQNNCDQLILVSGDSDLVPAVHRVKNRFPEKRIIVYIPAVAGSVRAGAYELRGAAHKARTVPLNLLSKAQFPLEVPDGSGGFYAKPASW